jgi:thymidylate kinase
MTGYLACLVGIDGSGKTTLAKNVIELMDRQGIGFTYFWGKYESGLLKIMIRWKNRFLVKDEDQNGNFEKSRRMKEKILSTSAMQWAFEGYVWFSYWLNLLRKLRIPLRLGRNILCDRYIYDTLVDMALDLRYTDSQMSDRLRKLQKVFPAPDAVYQLAISPMEAFQRKSDIPSLSFLQEKQEIYDQILPRLEVKVFPASLPPHKLAEFICGDIVVGMRERKS